ncbi:MAG: ROK family transcriptional regulator [Propionibacteriaceae bacterium]|jgi:predicted NBD/HSP70 family sugar kinase|nr:ROK family transcriptional regulator [Propionibacteriaceae bacterium]
MARDNARPTGITSDRRLVRPIDGRRSNLGLVLETLYDEPGLSRADLARRTGLTRVTISDIVAQLLSDGLIAEIGMSLNPRPGKRSTLLTVPDAARDIIAIDLSDQRAIAGAVCSLRGQVQRRIEQPLDGATGPAAFDSLVDLIGQLRAACQHDLVGVGVGTPGTVSPDGTVLAAHNLLWYQFPLQERLAQVLDLPVNVHNDANLAAVAEQRFGGGADDLVRVQISRGVGAGLLVAGQPVVGASGAAGEIGHVVVERNGRPCLCGKRGCLETWAAVPALTERIAAQPERRDALVAEAGRRLGLALAPVVGMLDLVDVVVGGPAELIDDGFLAAAATLITERTEFEGRHPVQLRRSELGLDAVLLGAVALVLRQQLTIH